MPLWWSVTIRNGGMGEAEIKIHNTNTFRGSRRYVRRLQRRYAPSSALEPPPDEYAVAEAPVVVSDAERREQSLQVCACLFVRVCAVYLATCV